MNDATKKPSILWKASEYIYAHTNNQTFLLEWFLNLFCMFIFYHCGTKLIGCTHFSKLN
jgi:hypothetical protein